MKTGFFAGSFSPFTNGHLHVVKTASKFLDKVIIGIYNKSLTKRGEYRALVGIWIN